MTDPWVATVQRVAQSYDLPESIALTLMAEGHTPGEAYLLVQAGLLFADYQQTPPSSTQTTTLPPPKSKP